MIVFVSSAQAAYLDAEGGAGGNTIRASDGDPDAWWTTTTTPTDTLWAGRPYGNDDAGNLGTALPADIFEATGNTTGYEDCIPIMTTISGLIPGDRYDVNIVYWSATSQNWAIRAGFSLDNMLYFDYLGQGGATAGSATGRTQSDRVELTGFIGRIQADTNGKILVYIDDKPSDASQGGWYDRTWYDGLLIAPVALTASNPSPPDAAVNVEIDTELAWSPGIGAHLHDVYFGIDGDTVEDADTSDTTGIYRSRQEPNTYTPPEALQWGQTYYWRIDEINEPNIWKGAVWSFTISFTQVKNEIIVFNDNGGWSWFQDERAIIDNDKLIIGSVADASGTDGSTRDGNIEVATYDLSNLSLSRIALSPILNSDDHAAPAFMMRPDGRILAVYCKHGGDSLVRYRISTNPGDTSSWAAEQTFNVNSNYGATYSNIYRLGSTGITYDFYRGQDYNPNVLYSFDDGASWSIAGRLIRTAAGTRPYAKYASDDTDRIYFTYTDGHPRDVITNIYAAYLQGSIIYNSFGIQIGTLDTTDNSGIVPSAGTKIFNADSTHRAWTSDMQLDTDGNPVAVYSVRVGTVDIYNDHRYRYARFDGASWHDYEIAYGGQCLYAAENDYTGLISLVPGDSNTVYISTNENPVTGEALISRTDGNRHYEIFKGQTDDYGASWRWAPITMDSTLDNIRPIVPVWDGQHTVLLWMRGTYYSYTGYDTDIVGIIDPQPLFENLTCEQLITLGYRLESDISGPAGEPDCCVNLYDMAVMAADWQLRGDILLGDISGPVGEPDYCVDLYDLIAMVAEWLACNNPQEATASKIEF